MRLVRIRIAWLMGLVALVAFNFAAINAVWGRSDRFNESWLTAALPMTNAIIAGLLICVRSRRNPSRRFWLGFEVFGAVTLGLYFAGYWFFPNMTGMHLLSLDTIDDVVWNAIPMVIVGLPQFIFALLGGWLFRNLRIR